MTEKEALKLAIKAMKSFQEGTGGLYEGEFDKEIKTCEEALAQPEQGHPQAWLVYAKGSRRYFTLTFDIEKVPEIYKGGEAVPLCTTPPQRTWVGLMDEEINNFVKAVWPREATAEDYIRAIEAKLKEKNT